MKVLDEGVQKFSFPDEWNVTKFDEWSFYRKQFALLADASLSCSACEAEVRCAKCNSRRVAGTKGVDFLAVESKSVCWHIEVKDYRQTLESSFLFLADEVAMKVRDTLACIVVARVNSNDTNERDLANKAVECTNHKIVLHLEQPTTNSTMNSRRSRLADVQQRLRQFVKPIDRRARVVDQSTTNCVAWSVHDKSAND